MADAKPTIRQPEEALGTLTFTERHTAQLLETCDQGIITLLDPARVIVVSTQQVSDMPVRERLVQEESRPRAQASPLQLSLL